MSFEEGQKLLYLTIKDERPHAEVVIFEGGTYFDQYDVISSNVYTKEQILEMFDGKSCVCPSSPPGVLLDDGTCGNCGGVVNCTKPLEPLSKLIKCPRCGEATRKGNRCGHCDSGIPLCYGVVAPRTQDCANCVYTVECLEEQKRPVISDDPTMMETWNCPKCDRVELVIYDHCMGCGCPNPKDVEKPPEILCPNCKQPVGDKYEHSGSDYDGISVDQWWECPDVETKEEVP